MRVGFVAPPHFPVPPDGYGAIAQDVYDLAGRFAAAGHEVAVLASGDSKLMLPGVELVPTVERSIGGLGLSGTEYKDAVYEAERATVKAAAQIGADVINLRWERENVVRGLAALAPRLVVSFSCGPDEQIAAIMRDRSPNIVYTAYTHAQRQSLGGYPQIEILPPGIDVSRVIASPVSLAATAVPPAHEVLRQLHDEGRDYATQVALVRDTKGQATAIQIANAAGMPIVLAGAPKPSKVDSVRYLEEKILPQVDNRNVFYLGPVDAATRFMLKAFARATLFCSGFEAPFAEAFGRVLAESTVVGTPVVGFRSGSFPEVVERHGIGLGFDTLDEAVDQLSRVDTIDRRRCAEVAARMLSSEVLIPKIIRRFERLERSRPGHNDLRRRQPTSHVVSDS